MNEGTPPDPGARMPSLSTRRALMAALGASAILAPASAQAGVVGERETRIAQEASAAPADGSSDNTTFSQDNRVVRLMAFDSAAGNLVAGDRGGHRDVLLFKRAGGFSLFGSL